MRLINESFTLQIQLLNPRQISLRATRAQLCRGTATLKSLSSFSTWRQGEPRNRKDRDSQVLSEIAEKLRLSHSWTTQVSKYSVSRSLGICRFGARNDVYKLSRQIIYSRNTGSHGMGSRFMAWYCMMLNLVWSSRDIIVVVEEKSGMWIVDLT